MATDYTKSSVDIIIDLINEANPGLGLTKEVVTVGAPKTGTVTGKDTDLVLTAVQGSGYTQNVTINYNRVDISKIPGTKSKVFLSGASTTIAELLPSINARYGINLSGDDVENSNLPAYNGGIPNEIKAFTITAKATSLVWRGTVSLQISAGEVSLASAVKVTNLDGLVFNPS